MAWSLVQGNQGNVGGAASIAVTYASPNSAGNLLVAVVDFDGTFTSLVDTAGNTWQQIGSFKAFFSHSVGLFRVPSCLAKTGNQVTLTASAATSSTSLGLVEFTGNTAGVIDGSNNGTSTTNPIISGNITTVNNGDLIVAGFGFGANGGSTSWTVGSGYTAATTTGSARVFIEYLIQASAGTINAQASGDAGVSGGSAVIIAGIASASLSAYSVPDCRVVTPITPNSFRTVNGTLIYDVPKADSRAAGAPVDCRAAGAPVDCRVGSNIPQNSRTPGVFGPGE